MIALLSDFGYSEYVGVMKGIIFGISPKSTVADLCHNIAPQNIKEGAWILLQNYVHFPRKTIFLAVVDPGVGSKRQPVAIETKNYYFVGPDNGLVWPAANEDGIKNVVALSVENASSTFHGRDVFAKAAAKLDKHIRLGELGKKTALKEKLEFHLSGREGEIVHIDSFGNIITNLTAMDKKEYIVRTKNLSKKMKFFRTYDEAPENGLFLVVGSNGTLEISIKNKNAAEKRGIKLGAILSIT